MILRSYYLSIIVYLFLASLMIGCSSSDVEEEVPAPPTAGDEGFDDEEFEGDPSEAEDIAELEGELDLEEPGEEFGEDFSGLPDEALGQDDSPPDPSSIAGLPDAPIEQGDSSELPPLPLEDDTSTSFPTTDTGESLAVPDTDPFGATDDSTFAGTVDAGPQRIPVKKIKTYPFNRGGILANAVYIARQGDDLSSISQTIYGTDRTSDLLTVNPNLHRGVDVGDKVYYNSPNRPQDSNSLLFYYEDIGANPQEHITSGNENIRDLAETLFGERESWKELWATNMDVESKWSLPDGLALRHWASASTASALPPPPPPVADSPPIEEGPPPPSQDANEFPDMAMDTTQGDIPMPPPPFEEGPPGGEALPPPGEPGPPGGDMPFDDTADGGIPPPPPPPSAPDLGSAQDFGGSPMSGQSDTGLLGLGEDESLIFLLVGVVIVMFVLIIAIRKKSKRRKMRVDLGDTQI